MLLQSCYPPVLRCNVASCTAANNMLLPHRGSKPLVHGSWEGMGAAGEGPMAHMDPIRMQLGWPRRRWSAAGARQHAMLLRPAAHRLQHWRPGPFMR